MKNSLLDIRLLIKISAMALIPLLLLFVFSLFYNQERVSAEQADETVCDKEIPIGEAFELASNIIDDNINELYSIQYSSLDQVEAANKMIELAANCNVSKCNSVCQKNSFNCGSIKVPAICYSCQPLSCAGDPCDRGQIQTEFNKVVSNYNQIKGSSKRMETILKGKADAEKKLYEARQDFSNCALSVSDLKDIEKETTGIIKKSIKFPLSCTNVLDLNLPRENLECKSLFNFFCCH